MIHLILSIDYDPISIKMAFPFANELVSIGTFLTADRQVDSQYSSAAQETT